MKSVLRHGCLGQRNVARRTRPISQRYRRAMDQLGEHYQIMKLNLGVTRDYLYDATVHHLAPAVNSNASEGPLQHKL